MIYIKSKEFMVPALGIRCYADKDKGRLRIFVQMTEHCKDDFTIEDERLISSGDEIAERIVDTFKDMVHNGITDSIIDIDEFFIN